MNVSHINPVYKLFPQELTLQHTALPASTTYNLQSYMGDISDLFSYNEIELPIPFVSILVSKANFITELLNLEDKTCDNYGCLNLWHWGWQFDISICGK